MGIRSLRKTSFFGICMAEQKTITCLVVEDEPELLEIIGFYIESTFGATIIHAANGFAAIEALQKTPSINLIISDYNMPKMNGAALFRYVREHNPEIPFVICSGNQLSDMKDIDAQKIAGMVEKTKFSQGFDAVIGKIFPGKKAPASKEISPTPYYSKVRVELIFKVNVLPCSLYVRLSEQKFVKVMNQGDLFTQSDIMRFAKKSVQYLYIESKDLKGFFEKMLNEYTAKVHLEGLAADTNDGSVVGEVQETIHDIGAQFGFTPELELVAKANVQLALKLMRKDKNMAVVLQKLLANKSAYNFTHGVAVATVACDLARRMTWDSEQTFFKLTLAALLHDSPLGDLEIAQVQDVPDGVDLEKTYSKKEAEAWRKHPNEAANIVKNFSDIPPDIDVIIQQHHERPDGNGMPNKLGHLRIAPLSAIFIVAHDMVCYAAELKTEVFDPQKYIAAHGEHYNVGQFRRILQSLADASGGSAAA